jgi:hypothetical protein
MGWEAHHELSASDLQEAGEVFYFVGCGQLAAGCYAQGHEALVHDGCGVLACRVYAPVYTAYASGRLAPHRWLRCGLQAPSYRRCQCLAKSYGGSVAVGLSQRHHNTRQDVPNDCA